MKVYQTNEIRNLALIGNTGSGKTTLAEAMLFEGGVINRRGDINAKNTVSDYFEIEQERLSSVYSTVLYTEFQGKKINFIDTPGLDDFIGGVCSSLHAAETAVMVLNAQNGVEVGSEITWRQTESRNKPVILVVNQLDHDKTNFDKTIEDARRSFGSKVALLQYPVNPGTGFNAIIDILSQKLYQYPADGGKPEIKDIPAGEKSKAEELYNNLVESAAENEEELMEIFFDKGELTKEELMRGIKKGIANRNMFPVFCVSSKKNMGVGRFLELICEIAPNPLEVESPVTKEGVKVTYSKTSPTSMFFFKNKIEPHLGEILFFKVMAGEVAEGMDLINMKKGAKERLSSVFAVAGKNRAKVDKFMPGDIGAVVKLKETKANHTLNAKGCEWVFDKMVFPDPKFRTAIKAVNEADEEKLSEILNRMHDEDPTIILEYSKELRQLIVHGQGELHLNIVKWHLDNHFKLHIEFITPKIPYRETITKTAVASYRHKKQSGGAGQFGEVHLFIEPYEDGKPDPTKFKLGDKDQNLNIKGREEMSMPWGGKLVYLNCIVGGVVEARFMPAILKGIMEKMETGPLTGSYARDIRVSVFDGKMHPVDSNEISFKIAGMRAFSDAFKQAGPKIMEPVYDVEVLVPSDKMGDVMSDLQGRRAIIMGMNSVKGFEKLSAKVPLAEMNKYSTALSSITSGRATYTMKFAEYAQVPPQVQDALLKAYEAESQEE
jgi:elongation factor G